MDPCLPTRTFNNFHDLSSDKWKQICFLIINWSRQRFSHWGRVTHICVNKLTIIGSDNGLSPSRRQAIIWTNAGILLIGTLRTNFREILIESRPFSLKEMHLKRSSGKRLPFCLGLNVLNKLCLMGSATPRFVYSWGFTSSQPQWHMSTSKAKCIPIKPLNKSTGCLALNTSYSHFPPHWSS